MKIELFSTGQTAAFDGFEQVPIAQKSWLILYAEYLSEQGIDPTKQEIRLPDGRKAEIFEMEDGGYNWEARWEPL